MGPARAARRLDELRALTEACKGRYRDVVPVPVPVPVPVLALAGLRWGELAGLRVGDRVSVPGPGLRLRRSVLASGGGGALYVDTLKSNRARTVPLVLDLLPIVDRLRKTMRPAETPGSGGFSSGAAYRNRTDDLRITRSPGPRSGRAACTDRRTCVPECSE